MSKPALPPRRAPLHPVDWVLNMIRIVFVDVPVIVRPMTRSSVMSAT